MAKVPALDAVLASHDEDAARAATKQALKDGASVADVAESLVAYADERALAGDAMKIDVLMFHAVHDGVAPSVLFEAIKRMARKPKDT